MILNNLWSLTLTTHVSDKLTHRYESVFVCIVFIQDIFNGKILVEGKSIKADTNGWDGALSYQDVQE